jgi:RimJ/RimL family protein N-acetyltransferase
MTSPSLHLEPLAEQHVGDVTDLIADPEVLRFTRVPEPPPPDFPQTWIGGYEQGRTDGTREGFAAIGADGEFLGLALAVSIDGEAGEVELGYIVAERARGRGVATEMLRQLTRWALDELKAERIYLIIDVGNPASERVAERCGYVREGVMRSIHVKQGIRADAGLWSRLPSDLD